MNNFPPLDAPFLSDVPRQQAHPHTDHALGFALSGTAQQLDVPKMDYGYPKEYTIGGLTVSGCVTRDPNAVKLFSGLKVGDKITIPGEQIGKAIRAIWDQRLFTDVRIEEAEIRGATIFLNIIVTENPQLASYGLLKHGDAQRRRQAPRGDQHAARAAGERGGEGQCGPGRAPLLP
ncbi:MAG: hypothetical protein IPL81_02255 [Flavobacteriales bacterium]|nr:hypothetical protein [Flavobacteriales bacterium]